MWEYDEPLSRRLPDGDLNTHCRMFREVHETLSECDPRTWEHWAAFPACIFANLPEFDE